MRALPRRSSSISGSFRRSCVKEIQNLAQQGEGPAPGSGGPGSHPVASASASCNRVRREVMLAMRAYELMVIFQGDVDDDALNRILAQGGKLIEAGSGRVAKTDRWGKRRFAYEINHKWEGVYIVLDIVT